MGEQRPGWVELAGSIQESWGNVTDTVALLSQALWAKVQGWTAPAVLSGAKSLRTRPVLARAEGPRTPTLSSRDRAPGYRKWAD